MDYAIKTLSQLRPILQGFRKSAGLIQAVVAELLGITQKSYAQLEANPAAASVERIFKVMRLLNVESRLSQPSIAEDSESASAATSKRQRSAPAGMKARPVTAPKKRKTGNHGAPRSDATTRHLDERDTVGYWERARGGERLSYFDAWIGDEQGRPLSLRHPVIAGE